MPWPTACSWPGCPAIVRGRYCQDHTRADRQRQDASRLPSSRRGYDAAWRRIRARVLAEQPWCSCSTVTTRVRTTEVDHVVPLAAGGTGARSNLIARCKSCHSAKTMRQSVARRG